MLTEGTYISILRKLVVSDLARFKADWFLHPEGTGLWAVGMAVHHSLLIRENLRLSNRYPTLGQKLVAIVVSRLDLEGDGVGAFRLEPPQVDHKTGKESSAERKKEGYQHIHCVNIGSGMFLINTQATATILHNTSYRSHVLD